MFDKIGDMPLHPLVIHAVVFGIPLAVLLALLFAFPKTREWARPSEARACGLGDRKRRRAVVPPFASAMLFRGRR